MRYKILCVRTVCALRYQTLYLLYRYWSSKVSLSGTKVPILTDLDREK